MSACRRAPQKRPETPMFQPETPIQVPQQGSQRSFKPERVKKTAIGIIAVLVVWGIGSRLYTRFELGRTADEQAIPTVAVAKSSATPINEDLVLPGDVQAYMNAPIYARTSGYLKRWLVDIGAP